jgi:hypothetical protein
MASLAVTLYPKDKRGYRASKKLETQSNIYEFLENPLEHGPLKTAYGRAAKLEFNAQNVGNIGFVIGGRFESPEQQREQ